MTARLRHLWERLRSSFWFIPAVMTLLAILAAIGSLQLDRMVAESDPKQWSWLREIAGGDPWGARAVLSTIASSMIGVAGVTFSILLVALSLTSSQFGSRLLRGFLRDRTSQSVLGIFIATFVYCLLVMQHVPMRHDAEAIPHVAMMTAAALTLVAVAAFIFFIHRAASSIQASAIIATAGNELDFAIRSTFPAWEDDDGKSRAVRRAEVLPDGFADDCAEVDASDSGYIEEIDTKGLVELAVDRDLVIDLLHGRGSFVVAERPLARVQGVIDDVVVGKLSGCVVLSSGRVSARDVERGVGQLVEVAVRALSPGINDPFTAEAALRRLGQSLTLLVDRKLPTPASYDEEGVCRVVVPNASVRELLHLAFDQIRHYGRMDPRIPIEVLEVLTAIGVQARQAGVRAMLLRHAEAMHRAASEGLSDPVDLERMEVAFARARTALGNHATAAAT